MFVQDMEIALVRTIVNVKMDMGIIIVKKLLVMDSLPQIQMFAADMDFAPLPIIVHVI